MVAMMGGREKVLAEARRAFSSGDSQFAAELTTYLIHIDTKDMDARHLKAAAFRKLGYAQITASWRNYYLVAAMELDDQIPAALYLYAAKKMLGTAMKALPAENQMALLPVRLKAEETLEQDLSAAVHYTDTKQDFTLHLRRGVLEVSPKTAANPAFRIEVTQASLGAVLGGDAFADHLKDGEIKVTAGDAAQVQRFFGWFDVPFSKKPEVVVR